MASTGTIIFVNLDDGGVEIVVKWPTSEMTIRAEVESLQADAIRHAAAEVVAAQLAHLQHGGYVIGEPQPGDGSD